MLPVVGFQAFDVRCWMLDVGRLLLFSISRRSSPVRRPASAFTLVELMVVVAVIALLIMLLIPNIRTAREKAWSSHCQNNLRQYAIAMNQYMEDHNGDFIYAGAGGVGAIGGQIGDTDAQTSRGPISLAPYTGGILGTGVVSGSQAEDWQNMVSQLPGAVSLKSLSAGQASIRVCPTVMQKIKTEGNFFDPNSPNFKGLRWEQDEFLEWYAMPDFAVRGGSSSVDTNNNLILDSAFTTYAINWNWIHYSKKSIPENVVAFIDWNAKEGWWAELNHTTWMFNSPDGTSFYQGQNKWITNCLLTEVGFYHCVGSEYGANYVAMDGHLGWVSSNTITITNFTGQ